MCIQISICRTTVHTINNTELKNYAGTQFYKTNFAQILKSEEFYSLGYHTLLNSILVTIPN